jgi:hypothetical protein
LAKSTISRSEPAGVWGEEKEKEGQNYKKPGQEKDTVHLHLSRSMM